MDLTIPDDAWTPADDGGRLVAAVSVNGLPYLAEAYPSDGEMSEDLALHHDAAHADGPFQSVLIAGRPHVVVVLPHA